MQLLSESNRLVKENLNVDADILNVIVVESYRSKYTEEDIRSDGRLDWVGLSYLLLGLKQFNNSGGREENLLSSQLHLHLLVDHREGVLLRGVEEAVQLYYFLKLVCSTCAVNST